MLTDLLSTVSDGGKVILEEENYLLARVSVDGKVMLAEISIGSTGGLTPEDWPHIPGVLLPDSSINPGNDSNTRILLFSIPENTDLYIEKIVREGRFSEADAFEAAKDILDILRGIHDEGYRIGYLGPENVLVSDDGKKFILGGARGIPDTPFPPPEAVGRAADDPRSDVYALGLFIFRLIAGSDNREIQVGAWNRLSKSMLDLLENMVSPEVDNRFPNLLVLLEKMRNFKPDVPAVDRQRTAKCRRSIGSRKKPPYVLIAVIAVVIVLLFLIIKPGCSTQDPPEAQPEPDSALSVADSLEVNTESLSSALDTLPADALEEPVIWISNGTGQPGRASEFRQGPVLEYSSVYTCTGSPRNNSVLMTRREDPHLPLADQDRIYPIAELIASHDTTMRILAVDITLLLGSDLMDDLLESGFLLPVSDPAGTLYVDIANHGLDGSFGGAGAATWVRSVLNNRSVILLGEEWLLTVVDFRDGDRQSGELGIPADLESTLFLYHKDQPLLAAAEDEIRSAILQNTSIEPSSITEPTPPDIWILLGQ